MPFRIALIALLWSSLGWSLTFSPDVPEDLKSELLGDLSMLELLEGNSASPMHRKIFGELSGKNYTKFFLDRVAEIGMGDCGPVGLAGVVSNRAPFKMILDEKYLTTRLPFAARAMILIHEARHAQPELYNHADCPTPFRDEHGKDILSILTGLPLAGENSCDKVEDGSYGVSIIFLKNLEKYCTICPEDFRKDAGRYADDQLQRIINPDARAILVRDLE